MGAGIALLACGEGGSDTRPPNPTISPANIATPTNTATPTATSTPEPTPTATPVPPTSTPRPVLAAPTRAQVSAAAAAPEHILSLIAQYPWPYHEAVDVADCESNLNPNARNPSGAIGLFQIIGDNPAMYDPATNVAAAYAKYQHGVSIGNPWYHWNNFGSCGHF